MKNEGERSEYWISKGTESCYSFEELKTESEQTRGFLSRGTRCSDRASPVEFGVGASAAPAFNVAVSR